MLYELVFVSNNDNFDNKLYHYWPEGLISKTPIAMLVLGFLQFLVKLLALANNLESDTSIPKYSVRSRCVLFKHYHYCYFWRNYVSALAIKVETPFLYRIVYGIFLL